jgi:hypothetical protein
MENKVIDYDVINAATHTAVKDAVKAAMKTGWQPLGGICIPNSRESSSFYQTIVKYEQPSDDVNSGDHGIEPVENACGKVAEIERLIVSQVVKDALTQGYRISVDDGGDEYAVNSSTNYNEVMEALMNTGNDKIYLYTKDSVEFGWIDFVYGNAGWDVISDHTTNIEHKTTILHEANAIAKQYETCGE